MKVEIKPDPKYNSVLVEKFVNQIMKNGKKSVGRKIVYNCFEIIKNTTKKDPLEVFEKAIKNVGPLVEVRPKRIGGATYQVPFPVSEKRRISLAMKWIRDIARKKKGKGMAEKLAQEIIDASNNIGAAVKKKEDTHKMAEANKAFAHFAS